MFEIFDREQIKRKIYYKSPRFIQKSFWNIYLFYIKKNAYLTNILKNGINHYNNGIIYIDPERIKYSLVNTSSGEKFKNFGLVKDGDWDLNCIQFEDTECFSSLKEHFVEGTPLIKTVFYKNILEKIENGKIYWGCGTKNELQSRIKKIDEIYNDIMTNGYKTQKELGNQFHLDEITVNINRKGEFIFEDGEHRLSIAKILGLKSVPVIITKRHYQWVKFKNEILSYAKRNSGKVYQPLVHPDLKNIPSINSDKRFNIILQNLPFNTGHVLDIGAQWGYFCHKFEELGFECCAVENNPTELYFLKKLRDTEGKKFKIFPKSIFEIKGKSFDIILALNIFHHFLKIKEDYIKLTKFLNEIDVKILFFQPHNMYEEQMKDSYINYDDIDFVNYIIDNSCLTNYKCIGEDERKIYMIYR